MERKTLSAHELNKYAYCPYQWYYERLYGRKELRRLYQERNERLQLEGERESRFEKGEKYYRRSYFFLRLKKMFWKGVVLLFLAAVIAGYLWIKNGGMV